MSARYVFRVSGRLSDEVLAEFEELQGGLAPPETVLHGEIADEAQLHGVLVRLQSLGLEVIDLRRLPD